MKNKKLVKILLLIIITSILHFACSSKVYHAEMTLIEAYQKDDGEIEIVFESVDLGKLHFKFKNNDLIPYQDHYNNELSVLAQDFIKSDIREKNYWVNIAKFQRPWSLIKEYNLRFIRVI